MPRKKKVQDEDILELYRKGLTNREIADALCMSQLAVFCRMKDLQLVNNCHRDLTHSKTLSARCQLHRVRKVTLVIDRLPTCLHTCLHCKHAVICEEYTKRSGKLVFDGCWKYHNIRFPVPREECSRFEESQERVDRKFREK